MGLKNWLQSKCPGCSRLADSRDEHALTRCELAKVRDRAQQIGEALKATRTTNIDLGRELDRKGQEISAAETEIGFLRKKITEVESKLAEKKKDCVAIWEQQAELHKELNAYKALVRINELQRTERMTSKSNRRQHPHLRKERGNA